MPVKADSAPAPDQGAVHDRDLAPLPTPAKAKLAVEILVAYLRVRWLLKRHDAKAAIARIRAGRAREPESLSRQASRVRGARLAWATERTLARVPTDSRCLMKSLVLMSLMSRRGMDGQVVLGVKSAPSFAAHAWVEHAEVALLPPGTDYVRLTEL